MDNTVWQEKSQVDEASDGSSDSASDRKRKHKDKKRKKEKKHKRNHGEKASDAVLTSATSTASATQAEAPSLAAPEAVPADTRPQREEWMGNSEVSFLFPSVLQQDLRRSAINPKMAAREAQQRETERLYKARELNPSIHGGKPEEDGNEKDEKEKESVPVAAVGDGGASWLKKAYRRLEEQAEDRGCSVAEVAAERFGSLEQLKSMIAAAEKREGTAPSSTRGEPSRGETERRPYEYRRNFRDDYNRHSNREGNNTVSTGRSDFQHGRDFRKSPENTKSDRDTTNLQRDRQSDRSATFRSPERPRDQNRERSRDRNRERFSREDVPSTSRPKPSFVKPGEELPSTWKARDKVQYVPKSNYTPAEKAARLEATEKREMVVADTDSHSAVEEEPGLSAAELNQLNARILRAELMGDSDTVLKLKAKIASGGRGPLNPAGPPGLSRPSTKRGPESVVLSREHSKGFSYPVRSSAPEASSTGKGPRTVSHNTAGQREKYFADDDKYSLSDLVSMEKMQSAEDQNSLFSRLASKVTEKTDDDYGMDDAFLKKALSKESLDQMKTHDRDRAITEHRQMNAALGTCLFCLEGVKFPKHLVIAVGKKALLMLPPSAPLTEGHCLICPLQHTSAATSLDEDVWEEMQTFRRSLVEMFKKNDEDCVFMQTVMELKRHPHMVWECLPLSIEMGSVAPMYFKKAILEAETEWAQNVKLVDLSKKDIRHAVPKNFPYFAVDFGMQGGYAHVIEDERRFPSYFGREIIGGMIDASPRLWLKHLPVNFNDQMANVNKFNKMWEPFDFTETR